MSVEEVLAILPVEEMAIEEVLAILPVEEMGAIGSSCDRKILPDAYLKRALTIRQC